MLSLGHRQCPLHSGGRTVRTAPHRGYEARGAWRGSPGVSSPPLAGGANRHFRLLRLIPCFAYFRGTPQLLKVLCLRAACASLPGGPAPPRPRWSRLSGRQDRAGTFDPARGARHRAPGAPARPLSPPPAPPAPARSDPASLPRTKWGGPASRLPASGDELPQGLSCARRHVRRGPRPAATPAPAPPPEKTASSRARAAGLRAGPRCLSGRASLRAARFYTRKRLFC